MDRVFSLRLALAANAVFSLGSAAAMIFFPSYVGEKLGVDVPLVLQTIGGGLVLFAMDLVHQATRQRMATWRALFACIGDFLWVLATMAVLMYFPEAFSSGGNWLVIAVAGIVFAFGAWQFWAIGRAHYHSAMGTYRHCILVHVNASADAMWRVVSRLGDIEDYMPSLRRSAIVNGKPPGVGAVRLCEDHAGKRWSEECTAFEAGHGFVVRFVAEAPDFPFPAQSMIGGWRIIPDGSGCRVMVWWELTPKMKYLAPIILALMTLQVDRDFPRIVHNMAVEALGHSNSRDQASPKVVARLLPILC